MGKITVIKSENIVNTKYLMKVTDDCMCDENTNRAGSLITGRDGIHMFVVLLGVKVLKG